MWLVLALPLAGSLINAFGWRVLPGRMAGWIGSAAIGGAFIFSIIGLVKLQELPEESRAITSTLYQYIATSGAPDIGLSIYIDPLAIFMALVVSGVSFLIHIYSVAYMGSDRGYNRYFSYLNFFVFSMLLLVLAGNFLLLIVGWAFVGFASYALISFYYRRRTATYAGMKAFVINVVGDVGMVLAAILIFREIGSLDFATVFSSAPDAFSPNEGTIVAICLLLLVGAFAKSAQLPLHTWLPDAMEGPTPVSALIHAATMVTAGVYLIARTHILFELGTTAADIAAVIGAATLIFAGTVALTQTDIKRIIAYSTISQIGYMIMAVSAAAYTAGLFHLMTHAFFKALLFMAAGSVIGAMAGQQSIDKMRGLKKAMPITYISFLIGALALAAFPGFSGFFSKDDILAYIAARGDWFLILYVVGYVGAFLTGLYIFRVFFRVFHGKPCDEAKELEEGHLHHAEAPFNPATGEPEDTDVGYPGPEHHIAEKSGSMALPMIILAVLAVIGGVLQIPHVSHVIESFLEPTFADSRFAHDTPSNGIVSMGLVISAIVAIASISLAAYIYLRRPDIPVMLRDRFKAIYRFLKNKWYFDEAYDAVIVRPIEVFGQFCSQVFDTVILQGILIGSVTVVVRTGQVAVKISQNGYVRRYVLVLVGGVALLTLYFLLQQ